MYACFFLFFSAAPLFALVLLLLLWQCFDTELRLVCAHVFFSLAPLFALVLLVLLWQCFDTELDNKEILDDECIRVPSKQTHLVIPQVVLMRWAHV